jgi:hypothetical protein
MFNKDSNPASASSSLSSSSNNTGVTRKFDVAAINSMEDNSQRSPASPSPVTEENSNSPQIFTFDNDSVSKQINEANKLTSSVITYSAAASNSIASTLSASSKSQFFSNEK